MKRLAITATMIGFLAAGPFATPARSQYFRCGGDLLTYVVYDAYNNPAPGVRCLRYYPSGAELFVWYGEGQWQQRKYRHVGIAFRGGSDIGTTGRAGDITGNGEDISNNVTGLIFQVIEGDWPNPSNIRVTGAWNAQWRVRPDGVNYTPLQRPTTCGPYFVQYKVRSLAGQQGYGLRCVLRTPGTDTPREGSPPYTTAWFGNGSWQGRTYSHIGRVSMSSSIANSLAGTGEASDICDPHFGQFCNSFSLNSLRFIYKQVGCPSPIPSRPRVAVFSGYDVVGEWNENWSREQPCDL